MSLLNRFCFITLILMGMTFAGHSQEKKQVLDTIEVSLLKNAYVKITSTKILSLDMGGDDNVLFVMDNGVIKMRAIKANFLETNFLVITQDTLLQYIVKFNKNPKRTVYNYDLKKVRDKEISAEKLVLRKDDIKEQRSSLSEKALTTDNTKGNEKIQKPIIKTKEVPILETSHKSDTNFPIVVKQKANISLGEVKEGIKIRLLKLYIDDKHLYFGLKVQNSTKIDYLIDYINFEVRSKSSALAATGNQSIYPSYEEYAQNPPSVPGLKEIELLFSIEKFALRSDELLLLTLYEKASASKGRSYSIKINSNDFFKIKNLN